MQNSKKPTSVRQIKVRDIRNYLARSKSSPEKFALEVRLSHMTIRRWLKQTDGTALPEKYRTLLAPVLAPRGPTLVTNASSFNAVNLMSEIEKSGKNFSDVKKLKSDLSEKLKKARVDRVFVNYCRNLYKTLTSIDTGMKAKAIAAGALLYFISPVDLIPDATPLVGYIDDLAVLSLAVESVAKKGRVTPEKKEKTELQNT